MEVQGLLHTRRDEGVPLGCDESHCVFQRHPDIPHQVRGDENDRAALPGVTVDEDWRGTAPEVLQGVDGPEEDVWVVPLSVDEVVHLGTHDAMLAICEVVSFTVQADDRADPSDDGRNRLRD